MPTWRPNVLSTNRIDQGSAFCSSIRGGVSLGARTPCRRMMLCGSAMGDPSRMPSFCDVLAEGASWVALRTPNKYGANGIRLQFTRPSYFGAGGVERN
jgi:hypothetical protein